MQCVDCVAQSARAMPTVRTVFGGTVREGRPVVTLTIIGICAAVYVLELVLGTAFMQEFWFSPASGQDEPWRFVTAAFLHSTSPLHILFNMYALWIVGPPLEQALGRARYVALYLLAAVGGQVAVLLAAEPGIGQAWWQTTWTGAVVGASGAIFGLFGAIFFVMKRLGRNANQILVLLAINLALPFFVGGLAWQAHVGGLVVGLVLGAVFAYAPRERRALWGVLGPVLVGVVLVLLTVWKYSTVVVPTLQLPFGG
ncbi:membrane associated rhomboid family serine protease [Sediminihabitans luteus]|uniref:Membrane associated rhomboid family serine protease n=2 Tax=Sediminihabitans luteus TaxID=1138585 RepID=A0A2M9CCT9_9CELL|nr:membrane associated rhomboid family serine protease [Sediminihabitans luteus]GII98831.1 rhomboid family intramembrane serine protease [Sediminihabitans luteus]